MKFDIDLLKKILIAYEDLPPMGQLDGIEIPGYDAELVGAHQDALQKAGLIEAKIEINIMDMYEIEPKGLTLDGFNMLNKLRKNKILEGIKIALPDLGSLALKAGLDYLLQYLGGLP